MVKQRKIFSPKRGEVILIENIRFLKKKPKMTRFSKKLGELGDIYINDAFSCSHRTSFCA